jgi:hypothetical protein
MEEKLSKVTVGGERAGQSHDSLGICFGWSLETFLCAYILTENILDNL